MCCSLPGLLHCIQITILNSPLKVNETCYAKTPVSICRLYEYPWICQLKTFPYGFELFACQLYGLARIVSFHEIRRMSNKLLKSSSTPWILPVILVCLFFSIGLCIAHVYLRIHNNQSIIYVRMIFLATGRGALMITILFHILIIWWIRSQQKLMSEDFAKKLKRVNAQRSGRDWDVKVHTSESNTKSAQKSSSCIYGAS